MTTELRTHNLIDPSANSAAPAAGVEQLPAADDPTPPHIMLNFEMSDDEDEIGTA